MAATATTTLKRKRPLLVQPVRSGESKDLVAIRDFCKANPKEAMTTLEQIVTERQLGLRDLNLRDARRAFDDIEIPHTYVDEDGKQRSMSSLVFPLLTGLLMVAEINDSYEDVETIGEELVTDLEDAKKITIIARLLSIDNDVKQVDELKDFPEISASEESYEVLSKRNGRKISISAEMVEENDLPNIIERVNKIVEIASDEVEELTLNAVCDRYGSATSPTEPYVLRKRGGSLQALYTTSTSAHARAPGGTSIASNALTSTSSLDAARTVLAKMLNDRGKRMSLPMSQVSLLVPDALLGIATKLRNSELEPGVENEVSNWGPKGRWQPTILSSPKLDDISTTDWFMGRFKKQFKRKWKNRFDYVTIGGRGTQAHLDKNVIFQGRVMWNVGVNAVDHVYVVRNKAS